MKYPQHIIHITAGFACAVLLLLVSGCSRTDLDGGVGCIAFSIEENDAVVTKATGDQVYAIDIVSEQGDTVAHYDDHRNAQNVWLKEGVYTVCASYNPANAGEEPFGTPRYGGKESVTIKAGEKAYVVITCTIQNTKIAVKEFDQEIRDNFTDYSLVVKPTYEYTDRDTLTFTQKEVDAEQTGWIEQTPEGTFVIVFRAFNQQSSSKRYTYVSTITGVQPADYYRFTVKMDPSGDPSDGGGLFYLSVQADTKEYEFQLDVNGLITHSLPEVTRADGGSINDPLTTNEGTRDGVIKLNIHADATMKRLRIRHEDPDVLLKYGLPGMITLGGDNDAADDEAQRAQLANVVTWDEGSIVGRTDTWIDFSNLMNTAKCDGALLPEGDYPVEIEVYDYDNRMVTQKITLTVARDFVNGGVMSSELINGIPGLGATYAYVTAQWIADETPAGLAFEYREAEAGDDSWQKVTVKAEDINEAEKSFRALLTGLTPNTQYVFRPVGDNVAAGSAALFTTDAQVEIPNLNFDAWYQGSAGGGLTAASGVWFPNAEGESMFWATGNPGTKISMALGTNITEPTDDAVSGKAVKMVSYGGVPISNHAAGNIYTGDFVTNISNPVSSAKMGRAYTGRPLALTGYYKYTSTAISEGTGENASMIGEPDKGIIYMYLEDWGNSALGPGERPDNAVIIAEGTLLIEEDQTEYKSFTMKLNYSTATQKPTHIRLVASSSYLGETFCGGNGSTLYVDEFKLIWSPDELESDE